MRPVFLFSFLVSAAAFPLFAAEDTLRETARPVVIQGDPAAWSRPHVKSLDPVADGPREGGDLMSFFYDQDPDRLSFKLTFYRAPSTPSDAPLLPDGVRAFVLMDYAPQGTTTLPRGIQGQAPFAWDAAVELTKSGDDLVGRALDAPGIERPGVQKTVASRFWSTAEASVDLPGSFREVAGKDVSLLSLAAAGDATPVRFYVFTADSKGVLDDLTATNAPLVNTHNVAFVQHLNQGLTYTTVFRGERGENAVNDGDPNNPDDGADELLAAHDYYNLPVNWHQGGLLISAAEWHDPSFNDWLRTGALAGRYDILTSAYGQHMMPFVRDDLNGKSVDIENDLIQLHYGTTPRVAWVPERVWCESPDNDGNGIAASFGVQDFIGDDFWDNGVWAVVLDDYVHCGYNNNAFNDHHVYTYGGGKILPGDNNFVGDVNWNAGNAWNRILSGTSDEIIIYHNDAEVAAEVSQGASNPNALNNYIWLLQQISNSGGSVGTWKLTSVLQDPGFTTQAITLQNGTYGLLGEFWGYGGSAGNSNFWYTDWAGYTGSSNLDEHVSKWTYGQQWDFALNKILAVPNNNLREMAWYVLATNLHETGWHDEGQISGWNHHYSNHMRSGNAHAEAARWAGGLYASPTGAYAADFEDDGANELVIYNDRLLAVFDKIGGKLQWLFCKGGDYNYSVVSNDNAYWVDTDGDYNETNHVAALSDVSVDGSDKEHEFYAFNVVTGAGNTVVAQAIHPAVTKTISLTLGNPYLSVTYETTPKAKRVYVKNGFSPDLLDLTWTGKSLERIWDPDGGGYFGQRNTNTKATAAIVVGTAGASQNQQFSGTLLEGDEFNGVSPFRVYVYGGFTSPLDGMGHVPELKTLRNGLVDTFGPTPCNGIYFPASNHLTIFFDQEVDASSVVRTGFAIDDDNNGAADVTLTLSDVLTTTGLKKKLDFDLSNATANAIEALNTASMELLLAAGSTEDAVGNPNALVTHVNDVPVVEAPATEMQIDGLVNDDDWATPRKRIEDYWDSAWSTPAPGDTHEINVIFVDWDATYLYLGIQGVVKANSWILYLDADVNGPNGYTNLTGIDTWERGATFTATGFRPDFHAGTYQHQGGSDSQSIWRLTSATTSVNVTSQVANAFDSQHLNGYEGGSEYAIPWDVIYGLGPGLVPAGTRIGVVASVCWDPDPAAELGGDVAPSNASASLPVVDNFCMMLVDGNSDGVPDPQSSTGIPGNGVLDVARLHVFPNPTRGASRIALEIPRAADVRAEVFDLGGRLVRVLASGRMEAGTQGLHWDGRDENGADAGTGIYFVRVRIDGEAAGATKITRVP